MMLMLYAVVKALVNPPAPPLSASGKKPGPGPKPKTKQRPPAPAKPKQSAPTSKKPDERVFALPGPKPTRPSGWIVVRRVDSKTWRGPAYGTGRNFTSDENLWHTHMTEQDAWDAVDWAEFGASVDVFEL